ncbi:hypothetical protein LJC61_00340 [Ruminococcaceae bacterium OttesenSCG-928-A16]|nr:hypothetical protein [Ruminococcaceae bacterium OttesenSCG-928-A16]
MKTEYYVGKVMKKIRLLPKRIRNRIKRDMENSITDRLENGETLQNIETEMGIPSQTALDILDGFRPEFKWRVSLLRYAYIFCALVPLLYILSVLVYVFTTPNPGGFISYTKFFAELFRELSAVAMRPTIIRLMVNFVLYLFICAFGYILYSQQLLLKRNYILAMFCLSLVIGITLHPSVYGVDTSHILYNTVGISIFGNSPVLWGLLQPQFFLAIYTAIACLLFYIRKSSQLTTFQNEFPE